MKPLVRREIPSRARAHFLKIPNIEVNSCQKVILKGKQERADAPIESIKPREIPQPTDGSGPSARKKGRVNL